jgi:hypothetical protein
MEEEFPPTILSQFDIDKIIQDLNLAHLYKMTNCTSCGNEMDALLTDYYTGQCDECFQLQKPWFKSSPVSKTHLKGINGI